MPTYDYDCSRCGRFERLRTVAQRDAPLACPGCGTDASRAVSAPALAMMDGAKRALIRTEERSTGYTRLRHPMGCACCR